MNPLQQPKSLVICGVIPARMQSERLPGKPLLPICSRPMIQWVYERARASAALSRLIVATDSDEIMEYCERARIPAVSTSSLHLSGTDRLIEVMHGDLARGGAADLYVNIQGDEPMVTAHHVELLVKPFLGSENSEISPNVPQARARGGEAQSASLLAVPQVSTLKVAIAEAEARDPGAVKVVTDSCGRALYFSRAPIPHHRDNLRRPRYYKHLGFYAYTPAALLRFQALPPSPLEQSERLEQLRFLENGIPIEVLETEKDTIGVDTEADLHRVEHYFQQAGIAPRAG